MWPLNADMQRTDTLGDVESITRGTDVTSGAASTYGTFTSLGTTTFAVSGFHVVAYAQSTTARYALSIALDSAGTNRIVNGLFLSFLSSIAAGGPCMTATVFLPIAVPSGTTLYAGVAASSATATMNVQLVAGTGGWWQEEPFSYMTTYGLTLATVIGAQVTPGIGSAKSAWTQITAATTAMTRYLVVAVGEGTGSPSIAQSSNQFMDIGVGPATETVLLPDIPLGWNNSTDSIAQHLYGPFPVHIPIGTRLTVRMGGLSTLPLAYNIVAYGIG